MLERFGKFWIAVQTRISANFWNQYRKYRVASRAFAKEGKDAICCFDSSSCSWQLADLAVQRRAALLSSSDGSGLVPIVVLILVLIGRLWSRHSATYSVSEVAGGSILLRSSLVPSIVSTTTRYAPFTLSLRLCGRCLRTRRVLLRRIAFLAEALAFFFFLPTANLRFFRAITDLRGFSSLW